MPHARDPRHEPRSARGARRGWRAAVETAARAIGLGLAMALTVACAEVEPTHARTTSSAEQTVSAPQRTTEGDARRPTAREGTTLQDLDLPSQRAVGSARSQAPLELELPPERVERRTEATAQRPAAKAAPRAVDRVRVTVRDQRLQLLAGREVLREYPVSTAKNGVGSQAGSQRTPLGRHRVHAKFGQGEPLGTIFESRSSTGRIATIHTAPVDLPEDVITTRILWLEGLEPGKNLGQGVDSRARYIYIHGTNEEGLIGQPASHGCVRMRNRDVLELFELVAVGTLVEILE